MSDTWFTDGKLKKAPKKNNQQIEQKGKNNSQFTYTNNNKKR